VNPEAFLSGDLVAALATGASDQEVLAFREWAQRPESAFSRSFREAERDHAVGLVSPTLYAVDATVGDDMLTVTLREAVVWTNRTDRTADVLLLKSWPAHLGRAKTVARVGGEQVSTTRGREVLEIDVPDVPPGGTIRLEIEQELSPAPVCASGKLAAALEERVAPCDEGRFTWQPGSVTLGNWLPIVLPYGPKGWDAPPVPKDGEFAVYEPALFHVRVRAPKDALVAGTGVALPDGAFVASAAREWSGLVTTEHQPEDVVVGDTIVRLWRRGIDAPDSLWAAPASFRTFTEQLGPLPWAEIDVYTAALEPGGFEYHGIAAVDPDDGYEPFVTAHEVAHQWFAGEIGSDPVRTPWLDESLTEWVAWRWYRSVLPTDAAEIRAVLLDAWADLALPDRGGKPTRGVNDPRERYFQAYTLGIGWLDSLVAEAGEDAVLDALRSYHQLRHCGTATPDDLLLTLRGRLGTERVDRSFARWMLGDEGASAAWKELHPPR
jgi:hypothetical protein